MKSLYRFLGMLFLAMAVSGWFGEASAQQIYWTNRFDGSIERADLNGRNRVEIFRGGADQNVSQPVGIAVDQDSGKLYWNDNLKGEINRANLDGTEVENIFTGIIGAGGGIALDTLNQQIYYTAAFLGFSAPRTLNRVGIDGTGNAELRVNFDSAGETRDGIALDVAGGKLYFTEALRARIFRTDLDGLNLELLYDEATDGESDTRVATSIALDLVNRKLYWTAEKAIRRSNLDGSGLETLFKIKTDGFTLGLALDIPNGHIYYVRPKDGGGTQLMRANLDGSGRKILINPRSTFDFPENIALALLPPVTPDTDLADPPVVTIQGRTVKLVLQNFGGALVPVTTLNTTAHAKKKRSKRKKSKKLGFRYEVNIERTDGGPVKKKQSVFKKISRRSQIILKKFPLGSYNARYRVLITKTTRPKSRVISRTEFSPDQTFAVGG